MSTLIAPHNAAKLQAQKIIRYSSIAEFKYLFCIFYGQGAFVQLGIISTAFIYRPSSLSEELPSVYEGQMSLAWYLITLQYNWF